jgi:hypothetical protein
VKNAVMCIRIKSCRIARVFHHICLPVFATLIFLIFT